MNERIKHLVEKANTRAFINEDGSLTPELQRFTELIVKECAELMKKESEEYSNIGSDYCDHKAEAFGEAVDLVKKHFGVE